MPLQKALRLPPRVPPEELLLVLLLLLLHLLLLLLLLLLALTSVSQRAMMPRLQTLQRVPRQLLALQVRRTHLGERPHPQE